MVRSLSSAAPLALLVAFGCSSGSGNPSGGIGGGGNVSTAAGYCDGFFGEVVRFFEQRCSAADKQQDIYMFLYGFLQGAALECVPTLQASIDKGRASIDAAAATACVNGYKQLLAGAQGGLNDFPDPDPSLIVACEGAIVGKQPGGAPCAQPFECLQGLTCVGHTPTADGVCGSPEIGQACGEGESEGNEGSISFNFGDHPECAGEAHCDSIYENGEFVKRCVAKGAAGEDCWDDDVCQTGLTCHLGVCGTTGPSAAGGPCEGSDDCQDGLYCDSTLASPACTAKKPSGATCSDGVLGGDECLGTCDVPEGADTGTCASFCGTG